MGTWQLSQECVAWLPTGSIQVSRCEGQESTARHRSHQEWRPESCGGGGSRKRMLLSRGPVGRKSRLESALPDYPAPG